MRALNRIGRALVQDRQGATAVEYGLILALVVLAVIASITDLARVTTGLWNDISQKVQSSSR